MTGGSIRRRRNSNSFSKNLVSIAPPLNTLNIRCTLYKFLSCNITKCQDYIVQHCYLVKIYNILLFVFEESCQPGSALKRSPTIFFSLFIFQSIIMLNRFTFSNRFNSLILILVKYCDRHLIDFIAFFSHSIHSLIYYHAKTYGIKF